MNVIQMYYSFCTVSDAKLDVSIRLQRPLILYLMYSVVTNLEISHTYGSFTFNLFLMAGGTFDFLFLQSNGVDTVKISWLWNKLKRVWKIF